VKFFGEPLGPSKLVEYIPAPNGLICHYCDEGISTDERGVITPVLVSGTFYRDRAWHRECLGHLLCGGEDQRALRREHVRLLFEAYESRWLAETKGISDLDRIMNHPSYKQIIALGPCVVPLLLERLRMNPGHWFYALSQITGEEPKLIDDDDTFVGATKAWIAWGKKKGLI
jgi:hypothetical protein